MYSARAQSTERLATISARPRRIRDKPERRKIIRKMKWGNSREKSHNQFCQFLNTISHWSKAQLRVREVLLPVDWFDAQRQLCLKAGNKEFSWRSMLVRVIWQNLRLPDWSRLFKCNGPLVLLHQSAIAPSCLLFSERKLWPMEQWDIPISQKRTDHLSGLCWCSTPLPPSSRNALMSPSSVYPLWSQLNSI